METRLISPDVNVGYGTEKGLSKGKSLGWLWEQMRIAE